MENDSQSITSDEFVERFVAVQSQVYRYIATLAPNRTDADELFQQTSLVLWRKREQFDRSGNFLHWACGVAYNEVRNHRRQHRLAKQYLSDTLVERLAELQHASAQRIDTQLQWLAGCLERLSAEQRSLLELCYLDDKPINAVAAENDVAPKVLYKRLDRLRWTLVDCIRSMERREGQP
jgi:RNA polymerase sigma-70 factor (ECF subfamily)